MGAVAEEQPAVDLDALLLHFFHLVQELDQVDHDPVGDHAGALVQNAGGDEVEDVLLPLPPDIGRRCPRPGSGRRRAAFSAILSTILPFPSSPHWTPNDTTGRVLFSHEGYFFASMFLRNCWNR